MSQARRQRSDRRGAERGADPSTRIEPALSDDGAPFWEGTRARTLRLPWCTECEQAFWYPRAACPRCLGSAIQWPAASGAGVVYASAVHNLPGPGRDESDLPYVVALVDLPEGVRMMSNIVDCEPGAVVVGMTVHVVWQPLSDGRHLPRFAPS